MSGEIDITTGYTFANNETITLVKLNQLVTAMVLRIAAGAVGTREIADGVITADKLDAVISAQLGLPDGVITLAKLAAGVLENSAAGRLKMADGFLSADAGGLAKMADGYFAATAAARAKFAAAFVTAAMMASGAAVPPSTDLDLIRVTANAAQSIPNNTETVLQFPNKTLDVSSRFNATGGTVGGILAWSYLPLHAGNYSMFIQGTLSMASVPSDGCGAYVRLYKNGAEVAIGYQRVEKAGSQTISLVDTQAANGSTDYFTVKILQDSGIAQPIDSWRGRTIWAAHLIGT
jgi:hypothetical protein